MAAAYKKNLSEAYATMKEHGWIIKTLDGEQCLYKKITPQIDVEVSGLNNGRVKRYDVHIYVWQIDKKVQTIETIQSTKGLEDVKEILLDIEKRYEKYNDNE